MPTISVFYGIVIQMFWRDHARPTFMLFMPNTKPSLTCGTFASFGVLYRAALWS
jgi:hypothetical protein